MATTLALGVVTIGTPDHAKKGIAKITSLITGTYVAGGITGIQTALRLIPAHAGITVVDIRGDIHNGTVYYRGYYNQATGAMIVLNGTAELAGGVNLTGYTLHMQVVHE